jgi:hypothetical protein
MCKSIIQSKEVANIFPIGPLSSPILSSLTYCSIFIADDLLDKFEHVRLNLLKTCPDVFLPFIESLAQNSSKMSQFISRAFQYILSEYFETRKTSYLNSASILADSIFIDSTPVNAYSLIQKLIDSSNPSPELLNFLPKICFDEKSFQLIFLYFLSIVHRQSNSQQVGAIKIFLEKNLILSQSFIGSSIKFKLSFYCIFRTVL